MTAKKRATHKIRIDTDGAPELTDAFFERADEYQGNVLVKHGRPSADVLSRFRADADLAALNKASGTLDQLLSSKGIDAEEVVAEFKLARKQASRSKRIKTGK